MKRCVNSPFLTDNIDFELKRAVGSFQVESFQSVSRVAIVDDQFLSSEFSEPWGRYSRGPCTRTRLRFMPLAHDEIHGAEVICYIVHKMELNE